MSELKPVHLIMVTTANNNKFYDMTPKGDMIEIKYGRVDSTCTTITKPISQWDKIYNSKIKKGYVDKSELIADLVETVKKDKEYKPIPQKVIAEIVERLQSYAKQAIDSNYKVKANQVTQAMIDEAQEVLIKLAKEKSITDFNNLLLNLFTVIPRKMAHVNDYLAKSSEDLEKILEKEQDLLDVMKSQVVVVQLQEESDDEYKNNCTILEALGLEIEVTTKEDVKLIKKELGELSGKYINSWKIRNIHTEERFNKFCEDNGIKDEGIRLLFHGTRNCNLFGIMQKGLLLRPELSGIRTNGKCFGIGIYSSTASAKSYNYTSHGDWTREGMDSAFMFLMQVAMGKSFDVKSFDSKYYDFNFEKLQKACPGAFSLYAHKGLDTGWWPLKNDEIVVFKEEQTNLKYLIELK